MELTSWDGFIISLLVILWVPSFFSGYFFEILTKDINPLNYLRNLANCLTLVTNVY